MRRIVVLFTGIAIAVVAVLDLPVLVPIKTTLVNVMPIDDVEKAIKIRDICWRAYVGDARFGGIRCYNAYASDRLRDALYERERVEASQRSICVRADRAFANGPPPELLELGDRTWWLHEGASPTNEFLVEIANAGFEAMFDRAKGTITLMRSGDWIRGRLIDCRKLR